LAAVDQRKGVLVLSKAREGTLHDKKFHDEEDIAGNVPDQIPIELDLGFLGVNIALLSLWASNNRGKRMKAR
jgi:hypothetical protein